MRTSDYNKGFVLLNILQKQCLKAKSNNVVYFFPVFQDVLPKTGGWHTIQQYVPYAEFLPVKWQLNKLSLSIPKESHAYQRER